MVNGAGASRSWEARSGVSDHLDDLPAERGRRLLEEHLARCPTCPPLLAALVDARDAVDRMRDVDTVIPPALVKRIAGTGPA